MIEKNMKINNELKTLADIDIKSISKEALAAAIVTLGANQEHIPPHETGTGLLYWQNEEEFAEFLKFIYNFKSPIKSYLEIGCRWGGTFIIISEILKRKESVNLYANDLITISENLINYETQQPFKYLQCDSLNLTEELKTTEQIDMIFIDGDHNYEHIMKDYKFALEKNPKLIIFHDICAEICPGAIKSWNEIKGNYTNTLEIIDSKPNGGYGIIIL